MFNRLYREMLYVETLSKKWFGFNSSDYFLEEDLKKKYRSLSKEHHPDLHPDDEAANSKFQEINRAYDFLRHFVNSQLTLEEQIKRKTMYNACLDEIRNAFINMNAAFNKRHEESYAERYLKNGKVIAKQIKPIYDLILPIIVEIDDYLHNYPDSEVTEYITEDLEKILQENDKISKPLNDFYEKVYLYHDIWNALSGRDFERCTCYYNYNDLGQARVDMQKARNAICHMFLLLTRKLADYIRLINNGTLKDENDSNLPMCLAYLKMYLDLQKLIDNIVHSGNYSCYLSDEEKLKMANDKANKQSMLVYSKSPAALERLRKKK